MEILKKMSKNRNRNKLNTSETSKEYRIKIIKAEYCDCTVCSKRAGSYFYSCSPSNLSMKHRHGNGRGIENHKRREFRSWKYNRKKQWKKE